MLGIGWTSVIDNATDEWRIKLINVVGYITRSDDSFTNHNSACHFLNLHCIATLIHKY